MGEIFKELAKAAIPVACEVGSQLVLSHINMPADKETPDTPKEPLDVRLDKLVLKGTQLGLTVAAGEAGSLICSSLFSGLGMAIFGSTGATWGFAAGNVVGFGAAAFGTYKLSQHIIDKKLKTSQNDLNETKNTEVIYITQETTEEI